MHPRITHLFAASLLAFTTGCAGSYSLIRPQRITSYTQAQPSGPVALGYQFDALRYGGRNKKYVKKELKYGYHVVAVKVTNNSDRDVDFSRDLNLMYGDRAVMPVPAALAARDLRQGVPIYLLYLLANVQVGGTTDVRTGQTTGGTFLPTGPLIAGANMIAASSANGNLRKEFMAYDLTNRTLKPGETAYGILSLRETAVAPLRLELRGAAAAPATMPPAATPLAPRPGN